MDAVAKHQRKRALYRAQDMGVSVASVAPDLHYAHGRFTDAPQSPRTAQEQDQPASKEESSSSSGAPTVHAHVAHHFADYFLVVGAAPTASPPAPARAKAAQDEGTGAGDAEPPAVWRSAAVLDRHPKQCAARVSLPPLVTSLCFPNGVETRLAAAPRAPTFLAFVLTEADGARTYGAVAVVEDELRGQSADRDVLLLQQWCAQHPGDGRRVFEQRGLCLVSRYPLYAALRDCLSQLCGVLRGLPVTSRVPFGAVVQAAVDRVPAPVPGGPPVRCFFADRARPTLLTLPAPTRLPLVDFALRPLVDAVGVRAAVSLFVTVLLERRVLFVSQHAAVLTAAAEGLLALLYPLCWPHVYIPVVGHVLADFLQVPTPFVMGALLSPRLVLPELTDVAKCNLDTGEVTNAASYPNTELFQRLIQRLYDVLFPYFKTADLLPLQLPPEQDGTASQPRTDRVEERGSVFGPSAAERRVDTRIRYCFLMFLVELLHDYRRFVFFRRKYPYPVVWFDHRQFIASRPREMEPFLKGFLASQAFNMFIEAAALQQPNLFDRACLVFNTSGGLCSSLDSTSKLT